MGTQDGGKITASYSVGTPTATTTGTGTILGNTVTNNVGGLTGNHVSGTTTNSYWDTDVSGITATGQGTGKTTSELKTPTGYTGIFANWEFDLDNADNDNNDTTGKDDQWNFGSASDYPVLQYHLTIPPQRASVTLSLSTSTIWERALTTPSRVNSATVTATLSGAWHNPVTVTPLADAAYSVGALTIAAGATTTTATLTAANNYKCGTSDCPSAKVNKSVSLTASSDDPWVGVGAAPSLTINDDDELGKPSGVKLSVDGTNMQVDWTAVTGATGYKVEWNTADSWGGSIAGSANATTNSHKITSGLTATTTYYFRVTATSNTAGVDDSAPSDVVDAETRSAASVGDYDADDDGLIEITTLAQLNAVRYDLDGDGVADDSANATAYNTAFPGAEDNMGCNESVASITAGTGNPACSGYELAANLDFNDGGDISTTSDDAYHNAGAGWDPIGGTYTATFDGGTYTISNLFINRSASAGTDADVGLFGNLGSAATIKNLSLEDVSVTLTSTLSGSSHPNVNAGGLAGRSSGSITDSYARGTVDAVVNPDSGATGVKPAYAGGLVGYKTAGTITASYAVAERHRRSQEPARATWTPTRAGWRATTWPAASWPRTARAASRPRAA